MTGIMTKIVLNPNVNILLNDEDASVWEKYNTKLDDKTLVKQKEIAPLLKAMTSAVVYIAELIHNASNDNLRYNETDDHYHKYTALEHK